MTHRLLIACAIALLASPLHACVPNASSEGAAGPDATTAANITPGVDGVEGRPTTIPGNMGGGINIGNTGESANAATGGTALGDLKFNEGQGTTTGTVADGPNNTKIITPTTTAGAPGTVDFTNGKLEFGPDGRLIGGDAGGTGRTIGGTVTLDGNDPTTAVTVNGTDITFSGSGTVKGATTVDVNGGQPIIPGSPTVHVPCGQDRLDSNLVYGED